MKKHEQIVIVCLAYIIGFTTAYIAFALSDTDRAIDAEPPVAPASHSAPKADARTHAEAAMTAEGLVLLKDGQERVLAARVPAGTETDIDGFHYDDVAILVSPNGQYVHYCAVVKEDGTCTHLLYSVAEDKVYQVYNGAGALVSDIALAGTSKWRPDGSLEVASAVSADPATPWIMR